MSDRKARLTAIDETYAFDAIEAHGRKAMADCGFDPNCCIFAARVAVLALERMAGIKARPLSVALILHNPPVVKFVREFTRWPDADEQDAVGGWVIRVGHVKAPSGDRWNGHLVAVADVGGGGAIVDLAALQGSRPERGMPITEPLVGDLPASKMRPFLAGLASASYEDNNGNVYIYESHPDDRSYRQIYDEATASAEIVVMRLLQLAK